METILNTAHSLILESIQYNDDGLKIELLELFRNSIPENIQITNEVILNDVHAIEPNQNSRKFVI